MGDAHLYPQHSRRQPLLHHQPIRTRHLCRLQEVEVSLEVDGGLEDFCSRLVNIAAERYPGRAFPEVGIHLAESTVSRALERVRT